jgi:hypothetical protein
MWMLYDLSNGSKIGEHYQYAWLYRSRYDASKKTTLHGMTTEMSNLSKPRSILKADFDRLYVAVEDCVA